MVAIAGAATVCILLLEHWATRRWRRMFLGGERAALLAAVAVALGVSVPLVPGRNLARFMFVSWTVMLLVVRTAYQASLYDCLQNSALAPRPNRMAALVAANYTFEMEAPTLGQVETIPQLRGNHHRILSADELQRRIVALPNVTNDVALVVSSAAMAYLSRLNAKRYRYGIQVIGEHLQQVSMVAYMPLHSTFKATLNDHVDRLHSSGLMDLWFRVWAPVPRRRSERETEPQPLRLDELMGTFVLCWMLMGVACVAFVVEVCAPHVYRYYNDRF